MQVPAAEIFKAYDVRGIVDKTLTVDVVRQIGRAFGSAARAAGQGQVVLGRDGRHSGPAFVAAFAEGVLSTGTNVIDIGCVATPITYFAAHHLGTHTCVSITGSHNPPEYNGLKFVLAGHTLHGAEIADLRRRIIEGDFADGQGTLSYADVRADYIERIASDIKLARPMTVVLDSGNGAAGNTAPALFQRLGCKVVELYSEVDGDFPNHHPDPSEADNLRDLITALRDTDAEVGLAFDGDGDRLGVVTKDGEIIYPDRQLMLFATDILARVPGGTIIYDVKCSRHLDPWIRAHGGQPLIWKTGHALVKAKLAETGAPLAGELSGHMFFKERWYGFDDGLYTGARLLEILSRSADACAALKALPNAVSTPELHIRMREGEPARLLEALVGTGRFAGETGRVTLDGLRVEFADGFGLVRASNTTPVAVLRFEADNDAALARIQAAFAAALKAVWPDLALDVLTRATR
ncbi:phosphomannomutase/phosphoglucomutase [Niveibacterium sp. 24ML]|uniref:phosphomannomutase/phosphoglucomutase n=1 Tax=Niveibacterium sp. 24ML TaxID=2985512 RepID=UPI00226FBC80|nr:phosphomannomutase/phosphoglucomutase [Niveibacterium sp. 24ML]MCX9155224.1 phosphomannomutase/phosphoglucomutase [Niveibacterium sp. 24ML]